MTTADYSQLGTSADLLGTDLIATWRSAGPLKTVTGAVAKAYFGADYLPLAGGTMTGALVAYAGTESLPGLSFASDTDTGIYRIAANNVGIAVGGVKVADFASGASSIVGTLTATAFSGPLTGNVTGNASTATAWATARAMTGDVTASAFDGSAAIATTLATVNSNVGSFTNASITVNAKGLVTAASSGAAGTSATWTPQAVKQADYTFVLGDAGAAIPIGKAGDSHTFTIPANASVAYPTGTTLYLYAVAGVTNTIAITSDTLSWFSGSAVSTGSRTLAVGGWMLLTKMTSTTWYAVGSGIT